MVCVSQFHKYLGLNLQVGFCSYQIDSGDGVYEDFIYTVSLPQI